MRVLLLSAAVLAARSHGLQLSRAPSPTAARPTPLHVDDFAIVPLGGGIVGLLCLPRGIGPHHAYIMHAYADFGNPVEPANRCSFVRWSFIRGCASLETRCSSPTYVGVMGV